MAKPRPKRWHGFMRSIRGRTPSKGGKGSIAEWLIGVPLLAVLVLGILGFIYFSFVDSQGLITRRTVLGKVVERVETRGSNDEVDMAASYVTVEFEGNKFRLPPIEPHWSAVREGDMVEVEIGRDLNNATPIAFGWRKPAGTPAPDDR